MEGMVKCFLVLVTTVVASSLEMRVILKDVYVVLGRPFHWTCDVSGRESSAPLTYHWRFQDTDILPDDSYVTDLGNGTLFFQQLTRDTLGTYTCVVSDGSAIVEANGALREAYVSDIATEPSEQRVQLGHGATFLCRVDARPVGVVTWTHNGDEMEGPSKIHTMTNDSIGNFTLQLSGVSYSSSGAYRCVLDHELLSQPVTSGPMALQVLGRPLIVLGLRPMTSPLGYNLTLQCQALSNPAANASWTFQPKASSSQMPSELIISSTSTSFTLGSTVLFLNKLGDALTIVNTSDEFSGLYRCSWTNQYGSAESSGSLEIYGLPQAPVSVGRPENISLSENSNLRLPCKATGNPTVEVSWVLPDGNLVQIDDVRVMDNGTFVLKNISRNDTGNYKCMISNSEGSNSTDIFVTVHFEPYFVSRPSNLIVEESTDFEIVCEVAGNPIPVITWKVPWSINAISTVDSDRNGTGDFFFRGNNLAILRANRFHHGTYTCVATNDMGVGSALAEVLVRRRPFIVHSLMSVGVVEGDHVVLKCNVDAFPDSHITWYHKYMIDPSIQAINMQEILGIVSTGKFNATGSGVNKIEPRETGKITQTVENLQETTSFSLRIFEIQEEEAGIYICKADNGIGSTHSYSVVRVTTRPSFDTVPLDTKVDLRDSAMFNCHSTGIPVPTQRWLFNGVRLSVNARYSVFSNGSLLISEINEDDIGLYTCLSTNQVGQSSVTAHLVLSSRPYFITPPTDQSSIALQRVSLPCRGNSTSPFTVSWYTSDKDGKKTSIIGTVGIGDDHTPVTVAVSSETANNFSVSGKVASDGSLIFDCADKSHRTWFLCELHNEDGETESDPVFLHVETVPRITSLVTPSAAREEDSLEIRCSVEGSCSNVIISWVTPQKEEVHPTEYNSCSNHDENLTTAITVFSVYHIEDSSNAKHAGDWWCKACNTAGCVVSRTSLALEGRPFIGNVLITRGVRFVKVSCLAFGLPPPEVIYTANETEIHNDTSGHYVVNQSLIVEIDEMLHEYRCQASNTHGTDTRVIGVPVHSANISQIVQGKNDIELTGETEQPYPNAALKGIILEFKAIQDNSWNSITHTIPNDITTDFKPLSNIQPGSMVDPCDVEPMETTTQRPADQDPQISNLLVESTGHSHIYTFHSLKIAGLNAYTTYNVRIKTTNGVGVSLPSDGISITTLPSAPSIVTSVNASTVNKSCTLTWQHPRALNGREQDIVTQIELFYNTTMTHSKTVRVTEPALTLFESLSVGSYVAKLTAYNEAIAAMGETVDFAFQMRAEPPTYVPTLDMIKSVTDNSFIAVWTIPDPARELVPPVTGFVLLVQSTDRLVVGLEILIDGRNTSSSTVGNLREHKEYSIQISSRNEAGKSPYSNRLRVTTRYAPFSEKVLDSSDPGYELSWKLIAIILVASGSALILFIACLVFSYQYKLTRKGSIDITSESTVEERQPRSRQQPEPETESLTNPSFMLY